MAIAEKRSLTPWIVGTLVLVVSVFLLVKLKPILTPFVIAGILAYILNPMVDKLQKWRVIRPIGAMLVMLLSLGVLTALLLTIVPMLMDQVSNLSDRLPTFIRWVHKQVVPWVNETFHVRILWNADYMADYLTKWAQLHNSSIKEAASKVAPVIVRQSSGMLMLASNLVLLPFLLYYFLLDWPRWTSGLRKLMPRRVLPTYVRIAGNMDRVLSEFLRGQLMVMIIMGLVYGGGLMLVGLESGFAIGMVAGLLVFVPYLGAFTGLLLATIAALLQFDGWSGLLMVWGVFAVGQFLESFFVTPKIVGDRIGLSPFWVIFALMAFGQLLGFVGMLLALPLAAITLVLVREGMQAYVGSHYYQIEPQPDTTTVLIESEPSKRMD
ncbi:AI-2E family transporter [Snodgrassella sp. CFCC 13594]|uniref:AI-2E family transporter n=1 Tax=Snodgrassella sp. CFCC 13594 TaxID=1775559 RepID=UPI00082984AE|nr:AI-2E family transporter [Snodgrassella sp. CFCC 13594]